MGLRVSWLGLFCDFGLRVLWVLGFHGLGFSVIFG